MEVDWGGGEGGVGCECSSNGVIPHLKLLILCLHEMGCCVNIVPLNPKQRLDCVIKVLELDPARGEGEDGENNALCGEIVGPPDLEKDHRFDGVESG